MKKRFSVLSLILFFSITLITGCSESGIFGDNDDVTGAKTKSKNGTIVVKITDAPFPIDVIKEANVVITKIEIFKTNEKDSIPSIVLTEKPDTFNLVNLRNGITEEMVKLELPAGSYSRIRMYTGDASVVLKDGREFKLKIPSGPQTGIKISIDSPIVVEGGLTSELLLDFDIEKSFNVQGNPDTPAGIKGFHFQPVVRAVNNSAAGRLAGTVKNDSLKVMANAKVWLKKDTVLASALTNTNGTYALIGIPAGTYTAFATQTGYDTVMVNNVKIIPSNQTTLNFTLKAKK
jgi:hypothetical protein